MPMLAELACMLLFNSGLAAVRAGRMMVFFSVLCLGACLQAVHSYSVPHAGLLPSCYLAQIA